MKVTSNTPPNPALTSELSQEQSINKSRAIDKTKDLEGARNGSGASTASRSSSQVEISDKARLLAKASEIIQQMPEVRADRVAQLKKSIGDGTYKVDSAAIADRVVDEHLLADFGKNNL